MKQPYPRHDREQRKAHELRMNVTEYDELCYKPPVPLTESQKEEVLQQVEDIKKKIAMQTQRLSRNEEDLEVSNRNEWYDSRDPNENRYD